MSKIVEVYHGATDVIDCPLCNVGREGLDFGPGFYVTDIYSQAVSWAQTQADRRKRTPLVNIYLLDKGEIKQNFRYKLFERYDDEWLEFIVACRTGNNVWKDYDCIEGGIADDRVINTVNMYMRGYYSKERAIQKLKYLAPNNQICLIQQDLIDKHLKFSNYMRI